MGKSIEELRNESILEGRIFTLVELVKEGSLDIEKAANKANMTVDKFKELLDKTLFQVIDFKQRIRE